MDKLTANGFTAVFKEDGCEIRDATGSLAVVRERSGYQYWLKLAESSKKAEELDEGPFRTTELGSTTVESSPKSEDEWPLPEVLKRPAAEKKWPRTAKKL